MAGITAGRSLVRAGWEVRLVDKSRAVGGRMATRRLGAGAGDQGAQHISVRTSAFAEEMARLVGAGVAREWLSTPSRTHPERGVESRYVGVGGMRRIPEHLAEGLDVRTATRIGRLRFTDGGIVAHDVDGEVVCGADAVVVTAPLPQALDLLGASGLARPDDLVAIGYRATLAVIALLDGSPAIPDGHLAPDDEAVAWLADNEHKGTSAVPSITVHSTPGFAAEHIDGGPGWVDALLAAARPFHAGDVVEVHAHPWRYAEPERTLDEGARRIDAPAPVLLAGEVFSGARVEGAHRSGLAAASLLLGGR